MQSDDRPNTFKVDCEHIHEAEKYRNVKRYEMGLV